jgi:hypothetical protein
MNAKTPLLCAALLVLVISSLSGGETADGTVAKGRPYYHESQLSGRFRQWRAAEDGALSVHLTTQKTTFSAAEGITLWCVVRNHSDKAMTILGPFGDEDYAHTTRLNVLGPDGPVAYDGPQKDYVLGTGSFVEVPAKSVVEGSRLYVIDYGYVSRGYPKQPPPANFWTGGVHTNAVTVMVK